MTNHSPLASRYPLIADLIVLRNVLGLTQADIAEAVEVSAASVANWESGRKVPSLGHLIRWADALGARIGLISDGDTRWQQAVRAAQAVIYGPGMGGEAVIDEALRAALAALVEGERPTSEQPPGHDSEVWQTAAGWTHACRTCLDRSLHSSEAGAIERQAAHREQPVPWWAKRIGTAPEVGR